MRVDISGLYSLAEKIENLEKNIYSLSDNATSASSSVISRTGDMSYAPLKTSCDKVLQRIRTTKALTSKICSELSRQTDVLRNAAASYRSNDRIDKVN